MKSCTLPDGDAVVLLLLQHLAQLLVHLVDPVQLIAHFDVNLIINSLTKQQIINYLLDFLLLQELLEDLPLVVLIVRVLVQSRVIDIRRRSAHLRRISLLDDRRQELLPRVLLLLLPLLLLLLLHAHHRLVEVLLEHRLLKTAVIQKTCKLLIQFHLLLQFRLHLLLARVRRLQLFLFR